MVRNRESPKVTREVVSVIQTCEQIPLPGSLCLVCFVLHQELNKAVRPGALSMRRRLVPMLPDKAWKGFCEST